MTKAQALPVPVLVIGGLLIASFAVGAYCLHAYLHGAVVLLTLAQGAIYVAAIVLLLRFNARTDDDPAQTRRALFTILAAAAVMRLCLLPMPPVSTDIYRYVWDGRVQASGVNPYMHIPADEALSHLRDEDIYEKVNRREYAPTIYPPMAQVIYWATTRIAETMTMMKAAMLAFEALTIWAIVQLLAARGLPLNRVLIYAWHPLPVWEIAGSGHIDAAAIAFMMLAFVAADRRQPWIAGAALAAGVGVKFLPLVVAPTLWTRWDWRAPLAAIVTLAGLYALYASAGAKIFGFLSGYADEQRLATGEGFYLWALLRRTISLSDTGLYAFLAIGLAALAFIAARSVFWRKSQMTDLQAAFMLLIVVTLITSPHHAWYLLWLTPFLAVYPWAPVLYVTIAAVLLYRLGWPPDVTRASLLYGPFALLLLWHFLNPMHPKEARHVRPSSGPYET